MPAEVSPTPPATAAGPAAAPTAAGFPWLPPPTCAQKLFLSTYDGNNCLNDGSFQTDETATEEF